MPPTYSPLPSYACLEVRGADARAFLQAQLTQSLEPSPGDHRAPLAAWLDARGRTRALLRVFELPDRWVLAAITNDAVTLVKRLRMFVLRSAVTIDVAADVELAALIDADDAWLEQHELPANARPGDATVRQALHWVCVGTGYWQVLGTRAALEPLERTLERAPPAAAPLAEIRLGIPALDAELVDRFVGQMLNLDALDALSFDKGCYPGQEIVARVRNLGGVKKRARRYAVNGHTPAVGDVVVGESREPAGEVIRAAATATGSELLAVVEHTAAAHSLSCAGAPLLERPLPFPIPGA